MEKERKEKKIKDLGYYGDGTLTEYIVKEGMEEIGECAFSVHTRVTIAAFALGHVR